MSGKNIDIVDKFLGVTLESTGRWNKHNALAKIKACKALMDTGKNKFHAIISHEDTEGS